MLQRIMFGAAALAAVLGAAVLVRWAAFPYLYAESGSATYAREHSGESVLQIIGAALLLWLAWYCARSSRDLIKDVTVTRSAH